MKHEPNYTLKGYKFLEEENARSAMAYDSNGNSVSVPRKEAKG
jgi:hypothetical protein